MALFRQNLAGFLEPHLIKEGKRIVVNANILVSYFETKPFFSSENSSCLHSDFRSIPNLIYSYVCQVRCKISYIDLV